MNVPRSGASHSVALDDDVFQAIAQFAEEAGTSKTEVASAICRLGLPYYQNRWREFLALYPELSRNGKPVPMTANRPTVPRP